jgi:hypothetical protein
MLRSNTGIFCLEGIEGALDGLTTGFTFVYYSSISGVSYTTEGFFISTFASKETEG